LAPSGPLPGHGRNLPDNPGVLPRYSSVFMGSPTVHTRSLLIVLDPDLLRFRIFNPFAPFGTIFSLFYDFLLSEQHSLFP